MQAFGIGAGWGRRRAPTRVWMPEGLRRRGNLTVWFTEAAIAAWHAEPRTTRGGQPWYSPLAILTALTLRTVFRLALRQTEGLIGSIIRLLGVNLPTPDHTTLSRRADGLDVPTPGPRAGAGALHLIVDMYRLKFHGPGERPDRCAVCAKIGVLGAVFLRQPFGALPRQRSVAPSSASMHQRGMRDRRPVAVARLTRIRPMGRFAEWSARNGACGTGADRDAAANRSRRRSWSVRSTRSSPIPVYSAYLNNSMNLLNVL